MAKAIPKKIGQRQLLIMDNASWYESESLSWHHFEPVYLPAFSPDFNPIERLWLRLKADWFYDLFDWTLLNPSSRALTVVPVSNGIRLPIGPPHCVVSWSQA
jgi:transposase